MMTDQVVKEFIAEWKQVRPETTKHYSFGEKLLKNEDLYHAISHVVEEHERFKPLFDDINYAFFEMCGVNDKNIRMFSIMFIPNYIFVYLNMVHSQKKFVIVETLLRSIYEITKSFDDGPQTSIRLPNVNLASTYHEPGGVSNSWLSENDLDRLNNRTITNASRSPLVFIDERVRAPQRLPLCAELWWIFNHYLPDTPNYPVATYLQTISKITTQGFGLGAKNSRRQRQSLRLVLSSNMLIEMVHTIYFAVYNGAPTQGEQVLDEVTKRATNQLWSDALVVCNAARNYLKSSELPVPVEMTSTFKKSIITNASFRTKKLPDDIPIIERSDSIDEGSMGDTGHTVAPAKSKSKLPHILQKIKRNSVVVINEEGDVETMMTSPPIQERERKKSIEATAV